MIAAVILLALVGSEIVPVSADLPELKLEALCRARSADDRLMRLAEVQRVPDCVHDETFARGKLSALWGTTSRPVRDRCKADAAALGIRSYVDLLTCIQMAADVKPPSSSTTSNTGRRRNGKVTPQVSTDRP